MARRPVMVAFDIDVLEAAPSAEAVREPLGRLRQNRVRVMAVTTGTEGLGWVRLSAAGLAKDVDCVESLEVAPGLDHVSVWQDVARRAGVPVDALAVVCPEPSVLDAAARAGATTAILPRDSLPAIQTSGPAEIQGPDVASVVDQLLSLPEAFARPPAGL